jgi:AAA domain
MQGQERDIVILSLVRSGNSIGFIRDLPRATVALLKKSKKEVDCRRKLEVLERPNEFYVGLRIRKGGGESNCRYESLE